MPRRDTRNETHIPQADDMLVRVAWLYYVEEMTQAAIGDLLGLTRRAVNEMLGQARSAGLVNITINAKSRDCIEAEKALERRFGLSAARVVPTPQDQDAKTWAVLGQAGASYLEGRLDRGEVSTLAVGWGNTLNALQHVLALRGRRAGQSDRANPSDADGTDGADGAGSGLVVKSIMGALTTGHEITSFDIVRGFAHRLDATGHYFAAPIYSSSPQSRRTLLEQPEFRDPYARLCDADIALVSVGGMSRQSLQIRHGLPAWVRAEELAAAGAVGDIIGRYLDHEGVELDHPINGCAMSPELASFRKIPSRVVISGGRGKHQVMRAVAQSGLATVLITDLDCARALLDQG